LRRQKPTLLTDRAPNLAIARRVWSAIVFAAAVCAFKTCHLAQAEEPAGPPASASASVPAEAAKLEFFEKRVRPLLVARCQECHLGDKPKGGFRIDSREHVLAGGDTGPAVTPGKPDESLLIDAVRYGATYQMPPKGRLPDEEVATLVEWVAMGALWPASSATPAPESAAAPAFDFASRAKHWCFQPLASVKPPVVKDQAWPQGAIDRFVLARLEANNFAPAPPVDKRVWLRRVTYDLIGLPPTPAEVTEFLADDSPQAFERVADRLLASPHYGERRARQWLDLARFAETYGHEHDFEIPRAFEYRDYLIRAFNVDLPYDQLVVEQLAGDLLDSPRRHPTERFNESILGTAFYFVGEGVHSPVDVRKDGADRIDNQIDVMAKTFLALTVSCARCHDHKFDAIRQQDYYALAGYLRSSRYQQAFIDDDQEFTPICDELLELRESEAVLFAQFAKGLMPRAERLPAWLLEPARASDEAWKNTLAEAASDPEHVLHAWSLLGAGQALPPEDFIKRRDELVAKNTSAIAATANGGASQQTIFADFEGADLDDWTATGRAFGNRPAAPADLTPADIPAPRLRPIGVSAAHSGLLSNKLHGVLRSPTFTITRPRIFYRLWGTGGQVRLIVDGLQLIQDPIYGGLKFGPGPDKPHWHAQDVSKWVGHRAYVELVDDGDGYLALDQIVFSASEPLPRPLNPLLLSMLRDTAPKTAEELAAGYGGIFQAVLQGEAKQKGVATSLAAAENSVLSAFIASPLAAIESADSPANVASQSAVLSKMATGAARREQLNAQIKAPRQALAMAAGTPEDEQLFIRGNHKTPGASVPRHGLEVLGGLEHPAPADRTGRLELARSLVDGTNPLAPRVIANRLWHWRFGRGLVASTDDFGVMGQKPTHPELLDWLAAELIRQRWSLKAIDRQIILSSAYRMSEDAAPEALAADPENLLWSHRPRRRLDAESIRDAVLAVSGRLDRAMYGPGVAPHLTAFMMGRGRPGASGPLDGAGRRSVYINVRRNFITPMLLAFDYPTPFTTIGRRGVSNVPAQALTMMNNPFVAEQAEIWARRVLSQASSTEGRVEQMYAEAFSRPPVAAEQTAVAEFLAEQQSQYPAAEVERAWIDLAHALMNAKEFIFVE